MREEPRIPGSSFRFGALRWTRSLAGIVLVSLLLAPMLSAEPLSKARVVRGASTTTQVKPRRIDIDLRTVTTNSAKSWSPGDPVLVIPRRNRPRPESNEALSSFAATAPILDPLLEVQASAATSRAFTAPILNFPGQSFTGVQPPDTVGDVGPNYYIQMVNGTGGSPFSVYDKTNGALVAGPISVETLATGDCLNGRGDPIVLYDHLASRWLLTEFSNTGNKLCIYISATSDPVTGGWLAYEFEAPDFPDYPKYAVWPDGYYVGTNESVPAVYVIDRTQMLLGASATMQRFTVSELAGFTFQMLIPADLDGTTLPPAGSPAYFVRHRDDESHNAPGTAGDFLEVFEFHADFATPANSTFTGPTLIPVTEFDSNLCGLVSFSCVPQPGGGTPLDPLREVVMWRAVYRNFGTHETLLGNFVTDVGDFDDHHGIRWFELQKTGAAWSLFQEGTYAPDSHHRWMGSLAMDGAQNIAIGYSISSATLNAGIRYTGRLQGDPLGTLPQPETTLQAGNGVHSGERWGDYSAMSIDPSDDCTFWYTNEYAEANGTWNTRIGSFKFDACSASPGILLSGTNLTQKVCVPGDLTDIELTVTGLNGFSDDVTLSFESLPTGYAGTFQSNPVTPPGSSVASVAVGAGAATGEDEFSIRGSAEGVADVDATVDVQVSSAVPGTATLVTPADGATSVSTTPTFIWDAATQAASYVIELDDDPAFGSIDFTSSPSVASATPATTLTPDTQYYWRVRSLNACGTGADSTTSTFTTAANLCSSPALAIPDNDAGGVTDTLTVSANAGLSDLDVSLDISHSYVGDLTAILTHQETGTSVVLMDRPGQPASNFGCSNPDVNATLDDEATNPVEDACALVSPAVGGTLTPTAALSGFDGETLLGNWDLQVIDNVGADTGTLNSWCLIPTTETEVCGDGILSGPGECDDGNTTPGDGCSATCTVESGYVCLGQPSACELDTDGDGTGNSADLDDDNDGVPDGSDANALDPDICVDADGDTCDDCAVGTDGFGPLADNLPANDGLDTDGDGACNLGDSDDDDDGISDFIEDGIGFDSLSADSDGNGTSDAQDLILLVLTCVAQPAPALGPTGVAVVIGLLLGLGLSRARGRGSGSD